jgi:hypothetical protein
MERYGEGRTETVERSQSMRDGKWGHMEENLDRKTRE